MPKIEVGYLGPPGTYSHLVAEKYFGRDVKMVPQPTVLDVCEFTSKSPSRRGIVPIENSSGGTIYETVDIVMANKPKVHIEKELSLDVKLALLGIPGETINILYSHFAPLEHCIAWVHRHLPRVERKVVTSTAVAAERASLQRNAAALGSRKLAKLYNLKILHYPVQADIANITTFLVISGRKRKLTGCTKTMIAARLSNEPGALFSFLEVFKNENVNLSRLISRPIRGCPREYAFLVDVDGGTTQKHVKRALALARKQCVYMRVAGSFATGRTYKS